MEQLDHYICSFNRIILSRLILFVTIVLFFLRYVCAFLGYVRGMTIEEWVALMLAGFFTYL